MALKTTRFDPMEVLNTPQDHIDLLNDALATGDSRVVVNVIAAIARGRGMSDLSRATGLGRSTLYKAIAEDANPTLATLLKVLDGLKLELRVREAEAA